MDIVTSTETLANLPPGTIGVDRHGVAWQKIGADWRAVEHRDWWDVAECVPITVLYRPDQIRGRLAEGVLVVR